MCQQRLARLKITEEEKCHWVYLIHWLAYHLTNLPVQTAADDHHRQTYQFVIR